MWLTIGILILLVVVVIWVFFEGTDDDTDYYDFY